MSITKFTCVHLYSLDSSTVRRKKSRQALQLNCNNEKTNFWKLIFLPFESKIFSFSFISADTTYSTRDIFSHIQVCFKIPHKLFCFWSTVNPWITGRDPSSGITYYFRKKHEHCEMFSLKLYSINIHKNNYLISAKLPWKQSVYLSLDPTWNTVKWYLICRILTLVWSL